MNRPGTPPRSPFTRRALLLGGGALGALAASGAALLMRGGGSAWYRSLLPPGLQPRALSEKALAVLHVFCDVVIGEPTGGRPSARDARLAERLDRELAFQFPRTREEVELALLLVEHGGARRLSFTRFTRLSRAEQEAHLEALARGTELEQQAFSQLRLLAVYFFHCDDRTWKAIHYEGPVLVQVRKPPEADSNPFNEGAARG